MICISKNFKFCGCADLTITTTVLGAIMALAGIINLVSSEETARFLSIWTLIFGISCAAVLFRRHNLLLRQILLGMFCLEVLLFLSMIAWFAYAVAVTDDLAEDLGVDQHIDNATTVMIIIFSVVCAFRTAILVMLGAVLYGGYKEQIAHEQEQESTQQKPASQPVTTVVIAGKQVEVVEGNIDQENRINMVV